MKNRYDIFAVKDDLVELFESIEKTDPIKCVLCGNFTEPTLIEYDSGLDIPLLGTAKAGQYPLEDSYIIVPKDIDVPIRSIHPEGLPSRYIISPGSWGECVYMVPSGRFDKNTIISGIVSAAPPDSGVINLFALFAKQ